jgi:fluoroacetyl-CoA thioesterase
MIEKFKPGDCKNYHCEVTEADIAAFHGETVHPVFATFALARDMEWSSRLFVLEMLEEDEQGIGTYLKIDHSSPAFLGEKIEFTACVISWQKNELICAITAKVGDRLVASGETGQKILKKEKLESIFKRLAQHG